MGVRLWKEGGGGGGGEGGGRRRGRTEKDLTPTVSLSHTRGHEPENETSVHAPPTLAVCGSITPRSHQLSMLVV